ncbi:hypothetical protein VOLCADRAFT_118602, partial [Volvox carteri f. nagariensis]
MKKQTVSVIYNPSLAEFRDAVEAKRPNLVYCCGSSLQHEGQLATSTVGPFQFRENPQSPYREFKGQRHARTQTQVHESRSRTRAVHLSFKPLDSIIAAPLLLGGFCNGQDLGEAALLTALEEARAEVAYVDAEVSAHF